MHWLRLRVRCPSAAFDMRIACTSRDGRKSIRWLLKPWYTMRLPISRWAAWKTKPRCCAASKAACGLSRNRTSRSACRMRSYWMRRHACILTAVSAPLPRQLNCTADLSGGGFRLGLEPTMVSEMKGTP